jgi:glyoxylase-like metal-dependent hydrolase (beta-lactamase superfamily II)
MKILNYSLGKMEANCYFLIKDNQCLVIDPSDEASFILEELQRRKLNLIGMLATHGHFDHVMAAGEIQLSFKVPLYIFEDDLFLIKRLNETAEYFLGYTPAIVKPTIIKNLKEGKTEINGFEFEVIKTPGHTPGSCSFYFEKDKTIFTGDTIFKNGIGRTDFKYSRFDELKKSLRKIFELPEETVVFCGHGEATTVGEEMDKYL